MIVSYWKLIIGLLWFTVRYEIIALLAEVCTIL